jgi:hypothetical protein
MAPNLAELQHELIRVRTARPALAIPRVWLLWRAVGSAAAKPIKHVATVPTFSAQPTLPTMMALYAGHDTAG